MIPSGIIFFVFVAPAKTICGNTACCNCADMDFFLVVLEVGNGILTDIRHFGKQFVFGGYTQHIVANRLRCDGIEILCCIQMLNATRKLLSILIGYNARVEVQPFTLSLNVDFSGQIDIILSMMNFSQTGR